MRRFLVIATTIALSLVFYSCGSSPREQFDEAVANGELSAALKVLPQIEGEDGFYICCTMLIDEYLAIDNLDKAIYIFDKVSPHCSMYEMQYESSYSTAEYAKKNAKKLYKKLIETERFEEAWEYHPLSYDDENYPGNAPEYFGYMADVLTHLCAANRKAEAQIFLNTHIHWFAKNVDNHEWGEDYPQYNKSEMQRQLQDVIMSF